MAPALNYGQQVYEGLKAFRLPNDTGISIFRPDRNATRLQHSANIACIPPISIDTFLKAVCAAVALNAAYVPPHETGAALYIRPQIYGSSAQLGLSAPEEYTFCVYVILIGMCYGIYPVKALILDKFDRAAPNGTGSAKIGGNYAPVLRWSDKARGEGFDITLHLDSVNHEEIDEFSMSGFIGVLRNKDNDITLVVPDSKSVIDSVTSDSVQQIAQSYGWKVEKRSIRYTELPSFAEVFAVGTAVALVPIRSITRHTKLLPAGLRVPGNDNSETVTYIPAEQEGASPVCLKLLNHLKAIQLGNAEDQFGWRFEVTAKDLEGIEGV